MYKYVECEKCRKSMESFKNRQKTNIKRQFAFCLALIIILFSFLIFQAKRGMDNNIYLQKTEYITVIPHDPIVNYLRENVTDTDDIYVFKSLELPKNVTGSFKTYMDYRTITSKASKQYNLQQLAKTDDNGFRVFNGKYLVAVGTYYAKEVGKELKITLDSGIEFYAVVGDIKSNLHTDINNQYIEMNGNIIEFIVDTKKIDPVCKRLGDMSNSNLNGKIIRIEEVNLNG